MKTYIKKVIVFDQPRKDEKSSNPNRVTVGAVVFDNPVGSNRPTTAVNLTPKEFDMLCNDLDIRGRDASGNMVSRGVAAWQALKGFVNRYEGAVAELEVEEHDKGSKYTNHLGEEVVRTDDMTTVRVSMIRLPHEVSDRLRADERSWGTVAPKFSINDFIKDTGAKVESNNTPE